MDKEKIVLNKEQDEVINFENGNIMVSASAGSGKTFAMIQRLIRLIEGKKADVDRIMAVTFTDASAADMKAKLKKELIDRINETGDKRLSQQLSEVDSADITTIDSFCLRLIKKYFFKIGVSPEISVADQAIIDVIKDSAIKRTFKEFYDAHDEDFLSLVDVYAKSRSDEGLKEVVLSCRSAADSETDVKEFYEKSTQLYDNDKQDKICEEYLRLIKAKIWAFSVKLENIAVRFEKENAKGYQEYVLSQSEKLGDFLGIPDLYTMKTNLKEFKFDKMPSIKNNTPAVNDIKELLKKQKENISNYFKGISEYVFDKEVSEKHNSLAKEHTVKLVKVLNKLEDVFSRLKAEENVMDYGDLERFALKILKDEEVKKSVREKYKYVFIDEYQDVNPVQEEIMKGVSNDNLFMVGDVKQSIYGFRGCRPDIFEHKFNEYEKGLGTAKKLNNNYRSAKAVINAVNGVFGFCMTKEFYGIDYKGKADLVFGNRFPDGVEGDFKFYLFKKQNRERIKEEPRIYNVLEEIDKEPEEETANLATLVSRIINGQILNTYYDPNENDESKRVKRIRYKDIAVLMRKQKNSYNVEFVSQLKKHGIPVVSQVKDCVLDYNEIISLLDFLRLIDNFNQDIPLASVLKSPFGNFTDEDLFEIRRFASDNGLGRSLFYQAYGYYLENADTPLKDRLKEFNERFNAIRFLSDYKTVGELLDKIIEDYSYEAYYLLNDTGKDVVERIRFFVSVAHKDAGLSVKKFLSLTEKSRDAFTYYSTGSEDAVNVMTVHASKGLEFPVVIVCGKGRESKSHGDGDKILFDKDLGLITKGYGENKTFYETTLRGFIKIKKEFERIKDEMSLFYVALTRATNNLYCVFEDTDDVRGEVFAGADGFLEYIPLSVDASIVTQDDLSIESVKENRKKYIVGSENKTLGEILKKRFSFSYPFAPDTSLPLKTSVTAVAEEYKEDERENKGVIADKPVIDITGVQRGITAHRILELFDFKKGIPFDEAVDNMVKENLITEEELKTVKLDKIKAVAENLKELSDKELYREKSFICSVPAKTLFDSDSKEEVVVQGVIDLLAIDGDNAYIYDYKYSSGGKETLKQRYGKQLSLYAYAVEKILKLKVVKKTVVSLLTGEFIDL